MQQFPMSDTKPVVAIAEQDLIDEIENSPECVALFEKVLGRSPFDCLLTDLSSLSDFTGSGVPLDSKPSVEGGSYSDYCRAWDAWVLARIEQEFGVRLSSTTLTLIQVVTQLQQASKRPTLN
jgi:hypothetical protein